MHVIPCNLPTKSATRANILRPPNCNDQTEGNSLLRKEKNQPALTDLNS